MYLTLLQMSYSWPSYLKNIKVDMKYPYSIYLVKKNSTWTNEQHDKHVKWICHHRSSNRNSTNCELSPEKKKRFSELKRDLNPRTFVCAAVLYQLSHEDPYIDFFGRNSQLLKLRLQLRWSHLHFICISAVHIISFYVSFLPRIKMNSINWPAPNV